MANNMSFDLWKHHINLLFAELSIRKPAIGMGKEKAAIKDFSEFTEVDVWVKYSIKIYMNCSGQLSSVYSKSENQTVRLQMSSFSYLG